MGCFMACFGLSNKRKRRKTLYKVLASQCQQKYGNYQVLGTTEKSIVPYSDLRQRVECKEQSSVKRKKKKKVTFNLNVQIYEINPTAYQVLDNEEEEEENEDITAEPEETRSYPSNYRYYNCRDDFDDEEDEIAYEESDIDDYDGDDDEFGDGGSDDECVENYEGEVFDKSTRQKKELSESCYSSVAEDRITNHMHSVLSPVENLTQWKAIKAKVVASSRHRMKENDVPSEKKTTSMPLVSEAGFSFSPCCSLESNVLQSKPLFPEVAVDASLSNWMVSPNYNVSKTTIHCQ